MRTWSICCLLLTAIALGAADASYEERVAALQDGDADARFALAVWCKQHQRYSQFTEWLEEVIAIEPDHHGARSLMGYEQVDGQWLRGAELKKAQGFVRHKGKWVSAEDYEKIQQGLIYHRRKWMTEEEYYKAKRYVKYLGKWISKSRHKRILNRQERLAKITRMRSSWDNAWEFDSKYFKVKTNCTHQVAVEMAMAMDSCYEALGRVFSLKRLARNTPLEIYATQQQFLKGSAEAGIPVSPGVLGYFYWGRGSGIRCFYAGSIDMTLKTLYHECTHLVVRDAIRNGDVPTWSNEGLAVFFEDARRTEDGGFDLLTVPWHRLWSLHDQIRGTKGEISLDELVGLPHQGYSGTYYPRGWSLIYFLLFAEDGKYRERFSTYYDLLVDRKGDMLRANNLELFRAAFGQSPDDLRSDWLDFITNLEPTTAEDLCGAALTSASARMDFRRARDYAQRAIDAEPREWTTHLTMGRVLLNQALMTRDPDAAADGFTEALAFFDKAVEMGRLEELEPKRGKSMLIPIGVHIDWARACIYAGEYERAADILEGVLEVDDLSSDAYKYLALLYGTATEENFRSDEQADRFLAIANDFGTNHWSLYVEAMLLDERGDTAKAVQLLGQAAQQDGFGFGAQFYRLTAQRLQAD